MLRHVLDKCTMNCGWRWLNSVDNCLEGKGIKYIALVTAEQQAQEASPMDASKGQ